MSAFGFNRYGVAFAEAVFKAGTRIANKPLTVVDLLASALWTWGAAKPLETTFRFVYPFVGGDAVAHSFNLANPATGRITWAGTITHDANGVKGDGTTGLGDTGIAIAGTTQATTNLSVGVYSRTSNQGSWAEIGNGAQPTAGTGTAISIMCCWGDGNARFFNGNYESSAFSPVTNSQGLLSSLRTSSTVFNAYRNGSLLGTGTVAGGNPASPAVPFNILGDTTIKSNRNLAFAFLTNASNFTGIGAVFTTAKQGTLYTLVQSFQLRLGRQV